MITPLSSFQLTVAGRKLRELVSARLERLSVDHAREKKLAAELRETEEAQRALIEKTVAMNRAAFGNEPMPLGRATQMQLGGPGMVGFGPCGHDEPGSVRHEKTAEAIEIAKADLQWLYDVIEPSEEYKLNRGDLLFFAGFGSNAFDRGMASIVA